MKPSERLFFIAFGLVATFIVTSMFRDRFRTRRIKLALANRIQSDDEQCRRFFPDQPRAGIAVRVRRVLANNLKLPLGGLTPTDRLNGDLNAELAANPHLFWELEAEFGIKTDVDDLEVHEKTLEQLVTFQDLVEYVERKTAGGRPPTPDPEECEQSSRLYDFGIRCLPVLFIGGFLTTIVGILFQKRWLMNLGGLIFLSGVALWGLVNGGAGLWTLIKTLRGSARRETIARPWPLIVVALLTAFFLWVGGMILWGILKRVLSPA